MLFNFLVPLADDYQIFNIFRYLTFRTGGAVMTALLVSFILGPRLINWLKSRQGDGQPIRVDGPASIVRDRISRPLHIPSCSLHRSASHPVSRHRSS